MANQVTLTFAGDADQLAREAKRAEQAASGVGEAAIESSRGLGRAAEESSGLTDRMSKLGNIADGASTALGDAAGTLQAFADISDMARAKQARLERALNDVAQAQADYNQAVLDGKQATQDATQAAIDERQATLDVKTAELELAAATREFGAGSLEAEQAAIDLTQAQADLGQATLDQEQALRDGEQALIDSKGAQLDLNDAMLEANPTALQSVADTVNAFAPLLQGLVGVLALVTAAQWAWNAAQLASPTAWIIIGIVALVAAIVWIATQTTWFQDLWSAAWSGITSVASSAWDFIKKIPGWIGSAFAGIANAITWPFRSGFNAIARLWNSTIGRLSWTVPGWVPFIGGNSISVPKLPTFHTGGVVPGARGSEVMAMLQAGERVIPADRSGSSGGSEIRFVGNTSDALATVIMQLIRTGKIQIA